MAIIAGPPVSGEDFKFRANEVGYVRQSLLDGTSVLIKGWRRIGKSSILLETHRLIEADGDQILIFVDVQDITKLSEFFAAILREMPKTAMQRLEGIWTKTKLVPGNLMRSVARFVKRGKVGAGGVEVGADFEQNLRDHWEPLKDGLAALAKHHSQSGGRIILFIDELPFFLENLYRETKNTNEVRRVLAALRAWRNAGLSMAIAGSVSIEAFLDGIGIEGLVINDLTRMELDPLPREEAIALIVELARVAKLEDWDEAATNAVLTELPDHYPFFIQTTMNSLRAVGRSDVDTIAEVFENQIHRNIFATFFQQFDERLEARFEAQLRVAAEAVLNTMAKDERGVMSVADIKAEAETANVDHLKLQRRLELAEFIRLDPRAPEYRLAQNLLRNWRQSRGAV